MLNIMCLVVCVLCLGLIVGIEAKNSKLIKETHSAKKEYLNAKTNNAKLESNFTEAIDLFYEAKELNKSLVKDMTYLQRQNSELRQDIEDLKYTVSKQSGLIIEMQTRVSDLEYDNKRLKNKLHLQDEVVKKSKVVTPFKAIL